PIKFFTSSKLFSAISTASTLLSRKISFKYVVSSINSKYFRLIGPNLANKFSTGEGYFTRKIFKSDRVCQSKKNNKNRKGKENEEKKMAREKLSYLKVGIPLNCGKVENEDKIQNNKAC
uniref:Uncharacterized protein n=1 Tax=Romanomermis culicivorax TaxID=13658 RepID=A0A915I3Z7_ROMCU